MRRIHPRPACARLALAAALTLGATAPVQTAPLPYFRAIALPELSPQGALGEGWTLGWALNDAGLVVGATQRGTAVQWSAADGLRRLGGTGGAYAVAPDGTAVGWVDLGTGLHQTAARWSPGTGLQALSDVYPGAATAGFGLAVNDAGWVLSGSTSGNVQLLRPGEAPLSLGPIADGGLSLQSNPMLNAGGMVAGTLSTLVAGQAVQQGWVWTASAGAYSFSAIAGQGTRLTGLNDLGNAVGWITPLAGGGPGQGLLYDANTRNLTQLLPGFLPDDINNGGLMVGSLATQDLAAAWVDGTALNLNAYTASLGDYTLTQAIDVNNRGQILAIGRATPANPATFTGPALKTFLLAECTRCGQILPNPIASGSTLDVGADWLDAHNALDFQNYGSLQLGTVLVNRTGASFTNRGDLVIGAAGRWSNEDLLVNDAGGRLIISGGFENLGGRGVLNRGIVAVAEGATLTLYAPGWLNEEGSTFTQAGGVITNAGEFQSVRAVMQQSGGTFSNTVAGSFTLMSSAASWAGQVTNRGRMQFTADPVDSPGLHAQVALSGQMQNLGSGLLLLDRGARFTVDGGQLESAGLLELTGAGTKLLAQAGATLTLQQGGYGSTSVQGQALLEVQGAGTQLQLNHGATLDVDAQGSFYLRQGAEAQVRGAINNGGAMALASGAVLAVSGRLENTGLLQVRGAGTVLSVQPSTLGDPENPLVLRNKDTGVMELTEHALLQVGGLVNIYGPMTVNSGAGVLVDGGLFGVFGTVSGDGNLVQQSGKTYVMGELSLNRLTFLGGQVGGLGVIRGQVEFDGTAPDADLRILPGNSPGTLTIDGDVSLDGATYELELGERVQDQLVITGQLALGRLTVALRPQAGYLPDLDDRFSFIRAAGVAPLAGSSAVTVDTSALGGAWVQQLALGGTGLQTTLDNTDAVQVLQAPAGQTATVAAGSLAYGRELRVGGRLEVAGSFTNRLLADAATGAMTQGAPMAIEPGASLAVLAGGRFSNRADLVNAGQIVNAGRFEHRPGATLDNLGTLVNVAGGRFSGDGSLRNAGLLRNEGEFLLRGRLDSVGGQVINASGGRFEIMAGAEFRANSGLVDYLQEAGGSTVLDGLMALDLAGVGDNAVFNGGTLAGTGTLSGRVRLAGGLSLQPAGDGIGTLHLAGELMLAGAELLLDIGPGSADLLDLGAISRLSAVGPLDIRLQFGLGQSPQAGQSFTLLVLGDPGQLDLAYVSVVALVAQPLGGYEAWTPAAGQTVHLGFEGNALRYEVQAVPEPQTWMLLAGGLLAVGTFKRRAGRR